MWATLIPVVTKTKKNTNRIHKHDPTNQYTISPLVHKHVNESWKWKETRLQDR